MLNATRHSAQSPAAPHPWMRWMLVCLLLGVLSGCGFQLRGQFNFGFDAINRRGMDNSDMARAMDLQLRQNNIKVNTGVTTPINLDLLGERRDREIVTFSGTGRAREVRISYTLRFQVKDRNGDFLIAPSDLVQRRELTYNDNEILGKEAEENLLYQEMQKDISRQILTRLSSLDLNNRVKSSAPPPASGKKQQP